MDPTGEDHLCWPQVHPAAAGGNQRQLHRAGQHAGRPCATAKARTAHPWPSDLTPPHDQRSTKSVPTSDRLEALRPTIKRSQAKRQNQPDSNIPYTLTPLTPSTKKPQHAQTGNLRRGSAAVYPGKSRRSGEKCAGC